MASAPADLPELPDGFDEEAPAPSPPTTDRGVKRARGVDRSFFQHFRRGETLLESGHYEEALIELKKAIVSEPAFTDSYVLIARVHEELGNYDDAIALYTQLSKQLPSDMDVLARLAESYERAGNTRKAVSLYKKLIRTAPEAVEPRCRLAKCLMLLGKHWRAIRLLNKALKANPACSEYLYLLGEIGRQQGNLEKAQDFYEQCLEFSPNHAAAKRGISYVIRAMDFYEGGASPKPRGERDEAFDDLREAVDSLQ